MKEFEKAQDYALKSIDIDKKNTKALLVLGRCKLLEIRIINLLKITIKKPQEKDSTYNAE